LVALILLLIPGTGLCETLAQMGMHPYVGAGYGCRVWEIPYKTSGQGCTPIAVIRLLEGNLTLSEGNRVLLAINRPGVYRIGIQKEGTLVMRLCAGPTGAKVDENSLITCLRIPLPVISVERKIFRVGYDFYEVNVCNRGTALLKGVFMPASPPFMAPLVPEYSIALEDNTCTEINVPVIVSFPFPLVNMPPQCITYHDVFGRAQACSAIFPTEAKRGEDITCVVSPQIVEILNRSPQIFELNGLSIQPFSYISVPKNEKWVLSHCKKVFRVEKREYKAKKSPKDAVLAGLILIGFAGIWARWESVKKG